MGAVATPLPETVSVDPGGEAVASIRVRNRSKLVDQFTFHVLGEPEGWTEVSPATLSLFPNGEGVVELRFKPPKTPETAPGLVPYGLLVGSVNDAGATVVEEGSLVLGEFREHEAQLSPRTSRGRFSGKHRLAVDNYGNGPAAATFSAEDAENALHVRFSPERLVVRPGTAAFARVKVKPQRKFLLGPPRVFPFQLHARFEEDGQVADVDGLHMQHAVLPRLLLPLLALAILAVILWAVFKPDATSSAKELAPAQVQQRATIALATSAAAKAQAGAAVKQATAATAQAGAATAVAASAGEAAKQAGTKAAAATAAAATAATPAFGGAPTGMRLALACPPTCTTTLLLAAGQTLYVTDILFGNPGNDTGTLRLTLDGKPVLVEGLDSFRSLDLTPSTPLLLAGGRTLALAVSCTNAKGACTPSVYLSGFAPAAPPDPSGPDGAPSAKRLDLKCPPTCSVTTTIAADATSYELTDVVFQNPAADTGTVTLSRDGQALLVEGLDAFRDLPISFTAPVALAAGGKLTLSVSCKNPKGTPCTPGALLNGVLRLPPPKK